MLTGIRFFRRYLRAMRARIINSIKHHRGEALIEGAPVMIIRSVEPALNPSPATMMIEEMINEVMVEHGLDTWQDPPFDLVALPGLIRHIANTDSVNPISRAIWEVMKWVLLLLIAEHNTEIIILFEHTHCAERKASNGGEAFAFDDEILAACDANDRAEAKILKFCAGNDRSPTIYKYIGHVSRDHDSRRRLVSIHRQEEFRRFAMLGREKEQSVAAK